MTRVRTKAVVALLVAAVACHAGAATFYVAPSGDDGYRGTEQEPFATLQRARDAVRTLKAEQGLREPVDVVAEGGTYWLTETLELTPLDSGTQGCPITYRVAEGETAVLSGGRPVRGPWRTDDGIVWFADLPEARCPSLRDERDTPERYTQTPSRWNFRQLFVDGKRATRARFPNADAEEPFLYARGGGHGHIQSYPGEAKALWADAPDAQVNIVAGWRFFNQRNDIAGVDLDKHTIRLGQRERHAEIRKDNWFWVEGVRQELDEPGEWYLDTDVGRVYYCPKNERDPNESSIVAPYLNRILYLKGDAEAGTHVEHVYVRGFDLRHTTYTLGHIEARVHTDAAVKFNNAGHCRVEDCRFENIGGYALWLHLDSCDNAFTRNTVMHSGGGGVLLTGSRFSYMDDTKVYTPGKAAARLAPLRNRIERNEAGHCGLIRYYGGGVHMDSRPACTAMMRGNTITNNYFHHLSRNGIFAFRNQGGNLMAYNRIDEAMLTTLDGGGIHMATMNKVAAPNYCIGNVISNVWGMDRTRAGAGSRHIARGIFLDWFTSSMVMRDNLTYNTWRGGYCALGGRDNAFGNNVVVKDPDGMDLSYRWGGSDGTGNRHDGNVICKNAGDSPCVDAEKGDFRLKPGFDYPEGFRFFDVSQAGLHGTADAGIAPEQLEWKGRVLHYSDAAHVSVAGEWEEKTATGMSGLFTYHYLVAQPNAHSAVSFTLPIPETGEYEVYVYYPESKTLATNAPVCVRGANAKAQLNLDQRSSGNWLRLGCWHFDANVANTVTYSSEDANGPVVADSVAYLLRQAAYPTR